MYICACAYVSVCFYMHVDVCMCTYGRAEKLFDMLGYLLSYICIMIRIPWKYLDTNLMILA